MPTVIQNLRGFFSTSFLALPLILYGWSFFMGLTTGNVGLLVLSIGAATVVPLVNWIVHGLLDTLLNILSFGSLFEPSAADIALNKKNNNNNNNNASNLNNKKLLLESMLNKKDYQEYFSIKNCEGCSIFQTSEGCDDELTYAFPSIWLAQIVFFFVYVISNASAIYNMKADSNASEERVKNRKEQANTVLIIASILFVALVGIRLMIGCETILGVLFGSSIFGGLSYAWYEVAKSCSMRDSDLFGIVQGILPPNINDQAPYTCVYQG